MKDTHAAYLAAIKSIEELFRDRPVAHQSPEVLVLFLDYLLRLEALNRCPSDGCDPEVAYTKLVNYMLPLFNEALGSAASSVVVPMQTPEVLPRLLRAFDKTGFIGFAVKDNEALVELLAAVADAKKLCGIDTATVKPRHDHLPKDGQ